MGKIAIAKQQESDYILERNGMCRQERSSLYGAIG